MASGVRLFVAGDLLSGDTSTSGTADENLSWESSASKRGMRMSSRAGGSTITLTERAKTRLMRQIGDGGGTASEHDDSATIGARLGVCEACGGDSVRPLLQCSIDVGSRDRSQVALLLLCCVRAACNRHGKGWRALRLCREASPPGLQEQHQDNDVTTTAVSRDINNCEREVDNTSTSCWFDGADAWTAAENGDTSWGGNDDDDDDDDVGRIEADLAAMFSGSGSVKQKQQQQQQQQQQRQRRRRKEKQQGKVPHITETMCDDADDEDAVLSITVGANRGDDGFPCLPCFALHAIDEPDGGTSKTRRQRVEMSPAGERAALDATDAAASAAAAAAAAVAAAVTTNMGNCAEPGEAWSGEVYEKSDDEHFSKFMKRVQRAPEQCARFCRVGAEPLRMLWPDGSNDTRAPSCSRCGRAMRGELQVMPQYQHFMLESIEWSRELIGSADPSVQSSSLAHAAAMRRLDTLEEEVSAWEWSTVGIFSCANCDAQRDEVNDARGGCRLASAHVVVVSETDIGFARV